MISTRNKNPRSTSKNRSLPRKRIILIVVLLLIVAGVSIWFIQSRKDNNTQSSQGASNTGTINMDPPTEEEKQAGDQQKEEIVYEQKNPAEPTDAATVVIVDANQYSDTVEVRAFISNRIDETGTCSVTFTKGSNTITKSRASSPDASTTQCGLFSIPASEFPEKGTWNLTVAYTSGNAAGQAKTGVTIK